MAGYGTGAYGTGAYGTGAYGFDSSSSSGGISISSAFATSERTVVVELTGVALTTSPIIDGDAENPLTWTVVRTDTNQNLVVLASRAYDGTNTRFELYTLYKFASYLIPHQVISTTLKAADGSLISLPESAIFQGCEQVPIGARSTDIVDVANPPFSNEGIAGTYQIVSSGDYANESGIALLRKLVIRRLTTTPGAFFHLPNYGLGIRLKEPLPATDLAKLRAQIELQLLQEPEFSAVAVKLSLDQRGILTIGVTATISRTNQTVAFTVQVPEQLTPS